MKVFESDRPQCPLCGSGRTADFFADAARRYLQCTGCSLVFVPRVFWLDQTEEKTEYDLHQNNPDDEGYRTFLSRLARPMLDRIGSPGKQGLDFGCGPGPALHPMFEENGHAMVLYDPIYQNHKDVLDQTYDFICATEVAEHLKEPGKTFEHLFGLLKPGGWLGLMTKLVTDKDAFARWHYIRDLTHVSFFSRPAFEYIARKFDADFKIIGRDVILLQKPEKP